MERKKKNRIFLVLLVVLSLIFTTTVFTAAESDLGTVGNQKIPVILYDQDSNTDGYLHFIEGTVSTKTIDVDLKNGKFVDKLKKTDFVGELPEGLILKDVRQIGNSKATLTFSYDGVSYFAGVLDLSLSVNTNNGSKVLVDVPIVAEVETPEKIPFGARLIRETGLGGAVEDVAEDIELSPYYQHPDFFNLSSSGDGDFIMLNNYRTIQQSTGWSCGLTAALTVVDWFDERVDKKYTLNEMDLATLRGEGRERGRATKLQELVNMYDGLNEKYKQNWEYVSTYDLDENGQLDVDGNGPLGETALFDAIPYYLEKGIPVLVGWQDWGGHYQVIVGYSTMGTGNTNDDVLILADPYDTTDHYKDGYIVQSYERFIWDWSAMWDPDFDYNIFIAAWPEGYTYDDIGTGGIADDTENTFAGIFSDDNNILYGNLEYIYNSGLKEKLQNMADEDLYQGDYQVYFGSDGLSGPASMDYYRSGDYDMSPFYKHLDFYESSDISDTLTILENYQTVQQATEYTCGVTTMLGVLNHFDKMDNLTEVDLADLRGKPGITAGDPGLDGTNAYPGSNVREMINVIDGLNAVSEEDWEYISSYDTKEGGDGATGLLVEIAGTDYDIADMIPYCVEKGIPVMVMWHEWGGHWQAVIGYDDMGTPGTQDDVLVLTDPYDTTDHNQDGYMIESYERLVYDWTNMYDEDVDFGAFVVMYPEEFLDITD